MKLKLVRNVIRPVFFQVVDWNIKGVEWGSINESWSLPEQ